eukprot:TRINITY_DN3047_c0_g1_i1.p1 TRINITY_DN3047_c0_g1~~TRINITY_DN3047_c0_g1_i1.p1  ORF type:complete len:1399 (-),score=320.25 TRINITY_DN3047_c0_g1_i1:45-4166(-)
MASGSIAAVLRCSWVATVAAGILLSQAPVPGSEEAAGSVQFQLDSYNQRPLEGCDRVADSRAAETSAGRFADDGPLRLLPGRSSLLSAADNVGGSSAGFPAGATQYSQGPPWSGQGVLQPVRGVSPYSAGGWNLQSADSRELGQARQPLPPPSVAQLSVSPGWQQTEQRPGPAYAEQIPRSSAVAHISVPDGWQQPEQRVDPSRVQQPTPVQPQLPTTLNSLQQSAQKALQGPAQLNVGPQAGLWSTGSSTQLQSDRTLHPQPMALGGSVPGRANLEYGQQDWGYGGRSPEAASSYRSEAVGLTPPHSPAAAPAESYAKAAQPVPESSLLGKAATVDIAAQAAGGAWLPLVSQPSQPQQVWTHSAQSPQVVQPSPPPVYDLRSRPAARSAPDSQHVVVTNAGPASLPSMQRLAPGSQPAQSSLLAGRTGAVQQDGAVAQHAEHQQGAVAVAVAGGQHADQRADQQHSSVLQRSSAGQQFLQQQRAELQRDEIQQAEKNVAEQKLAEQKLAEQKLAEQKLAEQKLAEQKLAEQRVAQRRLEEQQQQADQSKDDTHQRQISDEAGQAAGAAQQLRSGYKCQGNFVKPGDPSVVVVAATDPEHCDVAWLADQTHEVHVYSSVDKDGQHAYNGRQAAAYLSFILENYDHLPAVMAFVHSLDPPGHGVEHQAQMLLNIQRDAYPYVGLSGKFAVGLTESSINLMRQFMTETFGESVAKKIPSEQYEFAFPAGSSFLVTKERVTARKKDTWQKVYDWLQKPGSRDGERAEALEFCWHVLLGEGWEMDPQDPAVLCPHNPGACKHEAFVPDSLPSWRVDWYKGYQKTFSSDGAKTNEPSSGQDAAAPITSSSDAGSLPPAVLSLLKPADLIEGLKQTQTDDKHLEQSQTSSGSLSKAASQTQTDDKHLEQSQTSSGSLSKAASQTQTDDKHLEQSQTSSGSLSKAASQTQTDDMHLDQSHISSGSQSKAGSQTQTDDTHLEQSQTSSGSLSKAASQTQTDDKHLEQSQISSGSQSKAGSQLLTEFAEYKCRGKLDKPGDGKIVFVIAADASADACDVSWLADQPREAHVYSDVGQAGERMHKGYEVGAFLSYILENWDHLPAKVAFMKAYKQGDPAGEDALNFLSNLSPDAYSFVGLGKNFAVDLNEQGMLQTKIFMEETFGQKVAAQMPTDRFKFAFPSSGSFLVTKERILGRKKETWQKVYDWLQKDETNDRRRAAAISSCWHILLGEPWEMTPPDASVLCPKNPSACKLKAYSDGQLSDKLVGGHVLAETGLNEGDTARSGSTQSRSWTGYAVALGESDGDADAQAYDAVLGEVEDGKSEAKAAAADHAAASPAIAVSSSRDGGGESAAEPSGEPLLIKGNAASTQADDDAGSQAAS